ncbi:hypothetical protein H1R20_g12741, partial [Candolleomyces eurysporus]
MPSHRHRSRDRSDERRSRSPERQVELPSGASPLTERDYFQKSDEFRLWLKEEKSKYFDELSGERARSYFRKFVKAWNRGKLSSKFYRGLDPGTLSATSNTSYKWAFASKSNADTSAIRATREAVGAATYGRAVRDDESSPEPSSSRPSGSRIQGPTLPSVSDITLAKELEAEQEAEARKYKRKRDKLEAKERIEDMVGPRPVGREAMLEKKRAKRENDRAFRERGDDGLEADESTLLGGGDSFQAQIARRDAGKQRYEAKRSEEVAAMQERVTARREKEKATMDMFQQLAKQRFG